jgi:hypothetical protein
MEDMQYYANNKEMVDKKLAGLHKALAKSLMAAGNHSKLAREHLRKYKSSGNNCYFLWMLTYLPHLIRRVAFKSSEIFKRRIISIND